MWDCERSEKIRAESAQRQVRKMEVRYQRLDGKDGKDGKMGVTVMIDDRCDLAAYMGGVWGAYMEFRQMVTVFRVEACKIEARITQFT